MTESILDESIAASSGRMTSASRTNPHSSRLSSSVPAYPVDSTNIALLLWQTADAVGDRCAISERNARVSYPELRAQAAGVAAALRAGGVAPGDRVAIFLERGADAAAA